MKLWQDFNEKKIIEDYFNNKITQSRFLVGECSNYSSESDMTKPFIWKKTSSQDLRFAITEYAFDSEMSHIFNKEKLEEIEYIPQCTTRLIDVVLTNFNKEREFLKKEAYELKLSDYKGVFLQALQIVKSGEFSRCGIVMPKHVLDKNYHKIEAVCNEHNIIVIGMSKRMFKFIVDDNRIYDKRDIKNLSMNTEYKMHLTYYNIKKSLPDFEPVNISNSFFGIVPDYIRYNHYNLSSLCYRSLKHNTRFNL